MSDKNCLTRIKDTHLGIHRRSSLWTTTGSNFTAVFLRNNGLYIEQSSVNRRQAVSEINGDMNAYDIATFVDPTLESLQKAFVLICLEKMKSDIHAFSSLCDHLKDKGVISGSDSILDTDSFLKVFDDALAKLETNKINLE